MIDRGYDIYYKNKNNMSLLTNAINACRYSVVKKLIDADTNFIGEFDTYCAINSLIKSDFRTNIIKYCRNKYDRYKREIIATMNDKSSTKKSNALYQSFHTHMQSIWWT
ncbi:MAG: hypothetical protein Faunusvirus11_9 [Faunusvirus sp.]|jgi:hypothetical protein|uniref:Uncharacterized protein n=1 Tax=Faunusvirus sp. TaxID=2487766 RepID=A0A3G4ZX01_9VIRU|nr:MAG: hypothetical protein Faunusvirus11_9 [Faunusvirus sp.]